MTGRTAPPGDADELARVVGELLDDPAAREGLGRTARSWIERERTWTLNGERYRALYERHLEAVLSGLYEEYTAMCVALERVYRHPAVSLGLRLRQLLQRDGGG